MPQISKEISNQRKLQKKKLKQQKKRRKRINLRIERTVSFLAVLVCIVFSILDQWDRQSGHKSASPNE